MEAPTVAAPVLTCDTLPELNSSISTIVHTLATATLNTAASLGYSALTSPMMSFTTATDTTSPSEADIIKFSILPTVHTKSISLWSIVYFETFQLLLNIWHGRKLNLLAILLISSQKGQYLTADGIFCTPFHCHQRFLPFKAELHDISPDSVPFPIREIRCLENRLKAVLPRLIGTGMLIPARAGHG
ncbi:hypothetical protein BDP27DRAFT_1426032 [Rhodocollybia butyracea]|uniref:Uncharacterized protein n=1 Tax=Rhodocollybia butyracea TaxID=206335 RepID=A0A9P5U367_9AGAR|nr:hypothetical protein BDP27DRAFT_1426032 [Rhodocollybia butyracea]